MFETKEPLLYLEKLCRTCLNLESNLINIFDTEVEDVTLLEILLKYISLKVVKEDNYPKNICGNCMQQIIQFYTFRKQCDESQKYLHELLTSSTVKMENEDSVEPISANSSSLINKEREILTCESTKKIYTKSKDVSSNNIKVENIAEEQTSTFLSENYLDDDDWEEQHLKVEDHDEAVENLEDCELKRINQHKCDSCEKVFPFISNLKRHEMSHTGRKPYTCDICGKGYSKMPSLKQHRMCDHGTTEEAPYSCKYCTRKFFMLQRKTDHERTHERRKNRDPTLCKVCGKLLSSSSVLYKHLAQHKEKKHLCNYCGKAFHQKVVLLGHIKTHTGERPYKCDQCNKTFSQYNGYKTHKLVHSGEKPHVCKECGKSYTQLTHLIYHTKTHTGDRPHKCTFCDKGFKNKEGLKIHERIHTGETPYVCKICNRGFYDATGLNKHKRTHRDRGEIEENKFVHITEKGDYSKVIPPKRRYRNSILI